MWKIWTSILTSVIRQDLLDSETLCGCSLTGRWDRNEIELWTNSHPDLYSDAGSSMLSNLNNLVGQVFPETQIIYCPHAQAQNVHQHCRSKNCEVCTQSLNEEVPEYLFESDDELDNSANTSQCDYYSCPPPTTLGSQLPQSMSPKAVFIAKHEDAIAKSSEAQREFALREAQIAAILSEPLKKKKSRRKKSTQFSDRKPRQENFRAKSSSRPVRGKKKDSRNKKDTPCRYGVSCNRPNCWFGHPEKPVYQTAPRNIYRRRPDECRVWSPSFAAPPQLSPYSLVN